MPYFEVYGRNEKLIRKKSFRTIAKSAAIVADIRNGELCAMKYVRENNTGSCDHLQKLPILR